MLQKHLGQKVTVKLSSSDELTGKVEAVGEHVAHLSELGGKEFFDGVIDLEEISAVIVRAREQ